ncbi:hypothetical protein JIN82_09205 [Persicirhabdus sediminis]|uniref:Uncharacterized protein n=2 Tax=Persicirhabdus sediminis TaxID=454144 RepID=A0A8J7MER7_9BACT|nr:hypothetical protein [Persicirhabdus sediminis]
MAALRSGEKRPIPPAVYFVIAAIFSLLAGLIIGYEIWILTGYSPDNSGGSIILIAGSLTMSLLSAILYLFWPKKPVLFGLNTYTLITIILLVRSISINI